MKQKFNFFFFKSPFQIKDILQIHKATCPHFHPEIDLSLDGVQECKSSSLSADIYSISFKKCRVVYPVKVIRPINKFKMDDQKIIKLILFDIYSNDCILKTCICDHPKRAIFRCGLSHGAIFACEYCESKAVYISGKDKNGKKIKGHLTWPFSTANGAARTIDKIIEITDRIENGEALTREESKGFYGKSQLLHQPRFNMIKDLPVEYMHSGCIGVVKRMIELIFNVGENRQRQTKRKLSDPSTYNIQISDVQSVREFNRRFRNLDFGVLKAQEFCNISLVFFIIVLDCIPIEFEQERRTWLQLTFIMRACTIPNTEFEMIPNAIIHRTALAFYKNFESLYGKKNCSYSMHMLPNHILDIRGNDPLTEKSAFKFENFYSELRNLFQPGTISPSKQMLQNCYMKRLLENHSCQKSIYYDTEKKGRERNSLIYYLDENKKYKIFNIIEKIDNNNFICNPQGRFPCKSGLFKELNWEKVGVFNVGPYSNETVTINRNQIQGKVIKVKNFFVTCPNNVLREQ